MKNIFLIIEIFLSNFINRYSSHSLSQLTAGLLYFVFLCASLYYSTFFLISLFSLLKMYLHILVMLHHRVFSGKSSSFICVYLAEMFPGYWLFEPDEHLKCMQ